jgi:hypothetical protein
MGELLAASLHQSATSNTTLHLTPTLYKATKTHNHYVFTLKMETATSAKTLDYFQHLTWLIP